MQNIVPVIVYCKQGRLQVSDGIVNVLGGIFSKEVWSSLCSDVRKIAIQTGERFSTVDMAFYTSQGILWAEGLSSADAKKMSDLFPTLEIKHIELKGKREWYHDQIRLAYVASYENDKSMRKDTEAAAHFGWIPQQSVGVGGHVNIGRTATAAMLTGGVSLLFGPSRSKDKLSITFVRSEAWKASHPEDDMVTGASAPPAPTPAIGAALSSPTPAAPAVDYIEQLKKLSELNKAGILSDDEFAAKKADILAKM